MDASNVAVSADAQQKNDEEMNEEEDSDVEIEGVDMDADEEEEKADSNADDGDDDNEDAAAALASPSKAENEEEISALETEETHELEEARKERMELIQAERRKAEQTVSGEKRVPASAQERLDYLLAQSDVFAHFLAGKLHQYFLSIVCYYSSWRYIRMLLCSYLQCYSFGTHCFYVIQVRWLPTAKMAKKDREAKKIE
jgi:hypothetical protein